MKRLLTLCMVLSMAQLAVAAPYFQVSPEDIKDSFEPSDFITIQLVDDSGVGVVGFTIDAIIDNGSGGTAHEPLVYNEDIGDPEPLIPWLNYDGKLVAYLAVAGDVPGATGFLFSFEYHVPEVPYSHIIEIGTYADGTNYLEPYINYADGSYYEGPIGGPSLHMNIPEPATLVLLGLGVMFLRKPKR